MPLSPAALDIGGVAIAAATTHLQLHSAAPTAGVGHEDGSRTAATFTTDGAGKVELDSAVAFTGLTASGPVTYVSKWSASSGGTFLGQYALTGDLAANAAGQYTLDTLPDTVSAS
ncbi:hypothetical protein [Humibacter sp. RRB41]|uniref:phage tail fiber protein n=1 Tax=Humibacter sp. RRB41 TaxID=2919946 RepID=UPI001FAAD852|nr:hypothetical protein [Humibacter sp. RRB41]